MLDSFDQKGQSILSNFSLPNAARKLENYEPRPINWIKSILDCVSLPNRSEQVKTKILRASFNQFDQKEFLIQQTYHAKG